MSSSWNNATIEKGVDKLLCYDNVKPTNSFQFFPVIITTMKDSTASFCSGNRALSQLIKQSTWPVSHIGEVVDKLKKLTFFKVRTLKRISTEIVWLWNQTVIRFSRFIWFASLSYYLIYQFNFFQERPDIWLKFFAVFLASSNNFRVFLNAKSTAKTFLCYFLYAWDAGT